jgi:hypothetical protein
MGHAKHSTAQHSTSVVQQADMQNPAVSPQAILAVYHTSSMQAALS